MFPVGAEKAPAPKSARARIASPLGASVASLGAPKALLSSSLMTRMSCLGTCSSPASSGTRRETSIASKNNLMRFITSSIGNGAANTDGQKRKLPLDHVQILMVHQRPAQIDGKAAQIRIQLEIESQAKFI